MQVFHTSTGPTLFIVRSNLLNIKMGTPGPLKKTSDTTSHCWASHYMLLCDLPFYPAWLHLKASPSSTSSVISAHDNPTRHVSIWNISSATRMMIPSVSEIFFSCFIRFIVSHLWSVRPSMLPEKFNTDFCANGSDHKVAIWTGNRRKINTDQQSRPSRQQSIPLLQNVTQLKPDIHLGPPGD